MLRQLNSILEFILSDAEALLDTAFAGIPHAILSVPKSLPNSLETFHGIHSQFECFAHQDP